VIKPEWLRKPVRWGKAALATRSEINEKSLNTVCSEARCPNIGECFSAGVATFMILGEECTRDCGFCSVKQGTKLTLPNPDEPSHVAETAEKLKLSHVVITSVTRDDLHDGGAGHFALTIKAVRARLPKTSIEVLTPDFHQRKNAIGTIIDAMPNVFNHNVETVPRLYSKVRPSAKYQRSLALLELVKRKSERILTKSGLMLGFGETVSEVEQVMHDLAQANVDILTLGQYLRPTLKNIEVEEYVRPEVFDRLREKGLDLGFKHVFSGPFVRSSYHAKEVFNTAGALLARTSD